MSHENKGSSRKRTEQTTEKSAAVYVFPLQPGVVEARNALEEMCFAKGERDLFVLCDPALPCPVDVHTIMMVEDICSALSASLREGYTLAVAPLTCSRGTCAILQDESGVRMCIIEVTEAFFSEPLRLVSLQGALLTRAMRGARAFSGMRWAPPHGTSLDNRGG